jgi:hypothetical protein
MLHPVSCHSCIRRWGNNMVSQSLQKHDSDIVYLQKTKPCIRKHLITKADRCLVPPFRKIAFFFLRETDFFVSALNPALFLLSFSFCSLVNGTLPLKNYRHTHYPEIKNLHLSRWGTESVCRVI